MADVKELKAQAYDLAIKMQELSNQYTQLSEQQKNINAQIAEAGKAEKK